MNTSEIFGMHAGPGQPGNSPGEVSFFAGEPTRERQRGEQLARRLARDKAPEQFAASCRQMIDVYVTAAGPKLPSSTCRQGNVFR
jgi:hypothetical protein